MWYRKAKIDFNKLVKDGVLVSTCIVFKKNDDKIQVLLERRGSSPEKHKWCIPGGHIEKNETPEKAAVRELEEECNIKLDESKLLYVDKHNNERNTEKFNFIFTTVYSGNDNIQAGSDAEYIEWVDFDKIPELAWNNSSYVLKAKKLLFQ